MAMNHGVAFTHHIPPVPRHPLVQQPLLDSWSRTLTFQSNNTLQIMEFSFVLPATHPPRHWTRGIGRPPALWGTRVSHPNAWDSPQALVTLCGGIRGPRLPLWTCPSTTDLPRYRLHRCSACLRTHDQGSWGDTYNDDHGVFRAHEWVAGCTRLSKPSPSLASTHTIRPALLIGASTTSSI